MTTVTSGGERRTAPVGRRVSLYAGVLVVLVSAYPFVAFLNRNREAIANPGRLLVYGVLAALVSMLILAVVLAVRPQASADRLAVGVAAFLLSFWSFHLVFSSDSELGKVIAQLVLWAVLTGVFIALAYVLSRHAQLRFFVIVLALLLTGLPAVSYVIWKVTATDAPAEADSSAIDVEPLSLDATPNVYWFVLDEYARLDQMSEVLDFDNRPFHDELRDREFVVVEDVHSPFQATLMSLASTLDMDYVATTPEEASAGEYAFANRLHGDSATAAYFRAQGYDFVYLDPGIFEWATCDRDYVDYCIDPHGTGWNLDEMDLSLLDLTPIGSLDLAREPVTSPLYAVDQIEEHGDKFSEPFFAFSHIISPHSPSRYESDCSLRTRYDHFGIPTKSDQDKRNYVQDIGCLNENVLAAIDAIEERHPDAIIVVSSDHGSKFIPDQYKRLEDWRDEALREEFGALLAMRVPDRCADDAAAIENTVNIFRVVSACLEDRAPDLVADRSFLWPATGPGPQELTDTSVLDPLE